MSVPSAAFHRLKSEYAVNIAIPVDLTSIMTLTNTALVTVNVYYRAKPQSAPTLASAFATIALSTPAGATVSGSTATGPWSSFMNGFTFTPTKTGVYSALL